MRLILATIVAAATLTTLATPAHADGERGYGHDRGRGQYDNGQGGERGGWRDRNDDRRDYRRDDRGYDRRGSNYWGPSARSWSRWDNSWGDPHRFARQWGFDRYDGNRGWQRGNTWYSSPSQWGDWGGWAWSFQANTGNYGSYNNGYNNGFNNGYNGSNQYSNNQCQTYRTEDWINGRRAIVTYTGCADRHGNVYEQPNTRRIERWVW